MRGVNVAHPCCRSQSCKKPTSTKSSSIASAYASSVSEPLLSSSSEDFCNVKVFVGFGDLVRRDVGGGVGHSWRFLDNGVDVVNFGAIRAVFMQMGAWQQLQSAEDEL